MKLVPTLSSIILPLVGVFLTLSWPSPVYANSCLQNTLSRLHEDTALPDLAVDHSNPLNGEMLDVHQRSLENHLSRFGPPRAPEKVKAIVTKVADQLKLRAEIIRVKQTLEGLKEPSEKIAFLKSNLAFFKSQKLDQEAKSLLAVLKRFKADNPNHSKKLREVSLTLQMGFNRLIERLDRENIWAGVKINQKLYPRLMDYYEMGPEAKTAFTKKIIDQAAEIQELSNRKIKLVEETVSRIKDIPEFQEDILAGVLRMDEMFSAPGFQPSFLNQVQLNTYKELREVLRANEKVPGFLESPEGNKLGNNLRSAIWGIKRDSTRGLEEYVTRQNELIKKSEKLASLVKVEPGTVFWPKKLEDLRNQLIRLEVNKKHPSVSKSGWEERASWLKNTYKPEKLKVVREAYVIGTSEGRTLETFTRSDWLVKFRHLRKNGFTKEEIKDLYTKQYLGDYAQFDNGSSKIAFRGKATPLSDLPEKAQSFITGHLAEVERRAIDLGVPVEARERMLSHVADPDLKRGFAAIYDTIDDPQFIKNYTSALLNESFTAMMESGNKHLVNMAKNGVLDKEVLAGALKARVERRGGNIVIVERAMSEEAFGQKVKEGYIIDFGFPDTHPHGEYTHLIQQDMTYPLIAKTSGKSEEEIMEFLGSASGMKLWDKLYDGFHEDYTSFTDTTDVTRIMFEGLPFRGKHDWEP